MCVGPFKEVQANNVLKFPEFVKGWVYVNDICHVKCPHFFLGVALQHMCHYVVYSEAHIILLGPLYFFCTRVT